MFYLALLLASCLVQSKLCDNEESITGIIGWRYVEYAQGKDRECQKRLVMVMAPIAYSQA